MKNFKFRLEALLKVREHIEKERQKDHAVAELKERKQNEELENIRGVKDNTCQNQANRLKSAFSVADMLVYSRYLVRLRRDQVTGHELCRVLEKEEYKEREKLAEATKQKKIYKKLKEKQETAFFDKARKDELSENDEIALRNYRRRNN